MAPSGCEAYPAPVREDAFASRIVARIAPLRRTATGPQRPGHHTPEVKSRPYLAALLALVPALGCASGSRMIRLSPWGEGEPSAERTNLWPLYYADADRRAVLWPLADWDEQGFAVRPLIARDGNDLDVLWPLAHVELDDGSFWALTCYYDAGSKSWGLAPLVGWGEVRFVGPVWWMGSGAGHGLFPLYWSYPERDVTVVAPLYWDFGDSIAIAPLWWHSRTSDSQVLFPVWWKFTSTDGARSTRTLFPLWQRRDDGAEHHVITPLGGRGWSDDGSSEFTNVLGPIYHSSRKGDQQSYTSVAWPIFASERDGAHEAVRLLPLWARETDPTHKLEETEVLLGLGRVREDEQGRSWRAVPFASVASSEAHTSLLDLATLYSSVEEPARSTTTLGGSLLLHLERSDPDAHGEFRSWSALVGWLVHASHDSAPVVSEALQEWRAEQAPDGVLVRDSGGLLFDWFLWESTLLVEPEKAPRTIAHHRRVPLLWESERTTSGSEWDALLWCLHSTRGEEERRFVAGWGLYRCVERGERTTRDIFPFMTWDESPDESRFSFLGRVLDLRRHGERRSGHVLFVPFGAD